MTKPNLILIDNGHARSTKGKRSPLTKDGERLYEWQLNREITRRIIEWMIINGVKFFNVCPEDEVDVSLTERARRANELGRGYDPLLISVHCNASGNGDEWMKANGWSIYTTKGITQSDEYAKVFWDEANKILIPKGIKVRSYNGENEPDFEENFKILYMTAYPAVLTENLFYDNLDDFNILSTDEGLDLLADIHINAIEKLYF